MGSGSGFPRLLVGPRRISRVPTPPVVGGGAQVLPDSTMTKLLVMANGGAHRPQQVSSCTLPRRASSRRGAAFRKLSPATGQGPPAWGSPCTSCGAAPCWRRRLTAPRRTPARARGCADRRAGECEQRARSEGPPASSARPRVRWPGGGDRSDRYAQIRSSVASDPRRATSSASRRRSAATPSWLGENGKPPTSSARPRRRHI